MRRLQQLRPTASWLVVTLLLSLMGALAMGLAAPTAYAHGDLVDGSPGPGDALAPGGERVALRFDELADDGRALIAILEADGDPVAVGSAQTTSDARTVCATTAPLTEGVYTLEYSVTSTDDDFIRGKYTFEVTADGAPPTTEFTADCAGLALDAPGEAQTLDEMGTGEFPTWLPYLLGGLLVVALGLVVRRVRSDRRHLHDEVDEETAGD